MVATPDNGLRKPSGLKAAGEQLIHTSQVIVVAAAQLLVVASILVAAAILYGMFFGRLSATLASLQSLDALQAAVERVFAGMLLLLLGLELLKSLTNFFTGFQIQVEIIVIVAIIAVARHVMLVDLEHTEWTTLLGAAALVLALPISYALVRQRRSNADDDSPAGDV